MPTFGGSGSKRFNDFLRKHLDGKRMLQSNKNVGGGDSDVGRKGAETVSRMAKDLTATWS